MEAAESFGDQYQRLLNWREAVQRHRVEHPQRPPEEQVQQPQPQPRPCPVDIDPSLWEVVQRGDIPVEVARHLSGLIHRLWNGQGTAVDIRMWDDLLKIPAFAEMRGLWEERQQELEH